MCICNIVNKLTNRKRMPWEIMFRLIDVLLDRPSDLDNLRTFD